MKFYKNLAFMFKFVWRHNKLWILLSIISTFMGAISPLLNLSLPKHIIDSVFIDKDFKQAMIWVLILIAINIGISIISNMLSYFNGRQKNKLFRSFNIYIAELIMDMDFKELENPETIDMKDRAMQSAFSGGRGFCGSIEVFLSIVTDAIVMIGAIAVISNLNPWLIILIFTVIAINTFMNDRAHKYTYKIDKEKVPYERKLSYAMQIMNDFSFGKEVRLYGLKYYILDKYCKISLIVDKFYNKVRMLNTRNSLFATFTSNIQLLGVYFILLWQAIENGLGYGDFTIQFNAVNTLSSTILSIVSSVLAINRMGFYINDLETFIKLPRVVNKDGIDVADLDVHEFEFRNVCFKYPGCDSYALQNVSIRFSTNQKLSFVGLNGAGKTTFIKLLLRLYDVESGQILMDGHDITEYDISKYQGLFSSVFQDYKLFAYSVKENIVLSEDGYDEAKLNNAVLESGVSTFIERKNDGLNSYVYKIFDESGFEPSGGEGQKIAIARALYKDAKFIILDEPVSALDPIAEYDLYSKLNNLVKNKGCLFISHRLSSTVFADKIFVFNNGTIVESGDHKTLMKNEYGLYKEMFDKQSSYYKDN